MWSPLWTDVGFADILIFWGWCGSQLIFWNVRILHYGLLECLFGWVFHSDSVFKSDGYLWWWWWCSVSYLIRLYIHTLLYVSKPNKTNRYKTHNVNIIHRNTFIFYTYTIISIFLYFTASYTYLTFVTFLLTFYG